MRQRRIRYVSGRNFLCFGPKGIEIHFDDFGQVVLIRGKNLDYALGSPEDASNGTGKSSLQDLISYGFFGKTVKSPKKLDHGKVINSISKKGLEVEVHVDDYRIVRTRKPDHLRLWHSKDHLWDNSSEITKGTSAETQKEIERIVGLNHQSFCNVAVFDDSNAYSFLELDTDGKRNVTENLLGLDRYRDHHENAKEELKATKKWAEEASREYARTVHELDAASKRIESVVEKEVAWKASKAQAIQTLGVQLRAKQEELAAHDIGKALAAYEQAQLKIAELEATIPAAETKRKKIVEAIQTGATKLDEARDGRETLKADQQRHVVAIKEAELERDKLARSIKHLEAMSPGQKCSTCHGDIDPKNYATVLLHERNRVESLNAEIRRIGGERKVAEEKLSNRDEFIDKLASHLNDGRHKLAEAERLVDMKRNELSRLVKLPRPEPGLKERLLEEEINSLKLRQREIEAESKDSPYTEIIASAKAEEAAAEATRKRKEAELAIAEDEIPYYEYWVKAFGDKGIRRSVIDGIIPALNARIAYWLRHLIDARIEVVFDNDLKETITRNGTEAMYYAMSNGEKRRINLAVSQAFAYVMMLNCGSCPSVVFLDEITGGGIDRAGVTGIYNMVFELAKERQVFVTTHNQILLDMLQGCETLSLVKQGDFTTLDAR